MIKTIANSTMAIAKASKGNPVVAMAVVVIYYFMFSFLEAGVERLIFGDRFEHWLDPIFVVGFIYYSGLCVFACSRFNFGEK